jgi:hypothetical protein
VLSARGPLGWEPPCSTIRTVDAAVFAAYSLREVMRQASVTKCTRCFLQACSLALGCFMVIGCTSAPSAGDKCELKTLDCKDEPPDKTYSCVQQAAWGKCREPWMAGYCTRSCGLCLRQGVACSRDKRSILVCEIDRWKTVQTCDDAARCTGGGSDSDRIRCESPGTKNAKWEPESLAAEGGSGKLSSMVEPGSPAPKTDHTKELDDLAAKDPAVARVLKVQREADKLRSQGRLAEGNQLETQGYEQILKDRTAADRLERWQNLRPFVYGLLGLFAVTFLSGWVSGRNARRQEARARDAGASKS